MNGQADGAPAPLLFDGDAEVEALARQVLDGSLPKALWTHRAHLAFAAWFMLAGPGTDPARDVPDIIRAYNVASGTPNTDTGGYHETITQASLRAVAHVLRGLPAPLPLHRACNALFASPFGDKDWLLAHWSRPALQSVAARRGWVAPDLAPLPF